MADNSKKDLSECYIVALIDVLGQKELFKEQKSLMRIEQGKISFKTIEKQKRFEEVHKKTFGKIVKLRGAFERARSIYLKNLLNHPKVESLSTEEQRRLKNIANPISYQFFSDTLIIYTLLNDDDKLKMRVNLAQMIFVCVVVMLIEFSYGIFFRGGIEVGPGTEFKEPHSGIYGVALNGAYYIENEIAKHPRIVVGDTLKNLIEEQCDETEDSEFWRGFNSRVYDFCKSSITEDIDGYSFLDFLGESVANNCSKNLLPQSRRYICEGLVEIAKQYDKHLSNKNSKLCFRYERLKDYYLKNLNNWGLCQTTIINKKTQSSHKFVNSALEPSLL